MNFDAAWEVPGVFKNPVFYPAWWTWKCNE
jgi:hypothetical protein